MEPEIVNALITSSATILAALFGGWILVRINTLSKDEMVRESSGYLRLFWFSVGAIIGGGLIYFLIQYLILQNLPYQREISLTSFIPKSTFVGNERFRVDDFVDFRGNTYKGCFWAHAPSELTFDLNGKFSTFSAKALFHDYGDCAPGCSDGAQFVVFLDHREIFRSETMFGDLMPYRLYPRSISLHFFKPSLS
jgi:hypothetical protein